MIAELKKLFGDYVENRHGVKFFRIDLQSGVLKGECQVVVEVYEDSVLIGFQDNSLKKTYSHCLGEFKNDNGTLRIMWLGIPATDQWRRKKKPIESAIMQAQQMLAAPSIAGNVQDIQRFDNYILAKLVQTADAEKFLAYSWYLRQTVGPSWRYEHMENIIWSLAPKFGDGVLRVLKNREAAVELTGER